MNEIMLGGYSLKYDENLDMYSMTTLWKQLGKDPSKRPVDWLNLPSTKEYIKALKAKKTLGYRSGKNPLQDLFKVIRGRNSSTYANWMVLLAYAKYLSPDFHILVNEYFTRLFAGDVTLADEIYDRASNEGKEWLQKRIEGKEFRRTFTDTLQTHGVTGVGYAICTNTIYEETLGAKTAVLKQERNLDKKDNLRDHLDKSELVVIGAAETYSSKLIKKRDDYGTAQCDRSCRQVSQAFNKAIQEIEQLE